MLQKAVVTACLPVSDLGRAKAFYTEKLGLTPTDETAAGVIFECLGGTRFIIFPSSGSASGTYTQINFDLEDVGDEVKQLKARGVTFEEYDLPGLKTIDGVAEMEVEICAWIKDTEGNLLGLRQPVKAAVSS